MSNAARHPVVAWTFRLTAAVALCTLGGCDWERMGLGPEAHTVIESALTPAAATQPTATDLWKDPAFLRQFVAYYGINSEIEPRLTPAEIVELERVRERMKAEPPDLAGAKKQMAASMRKLKAEAEEKDYQHSATLDFTLGGIHYQAGEMDAAMQCYATAIAKFPNFRRAHRQLGLIYASKGQYDLAINSFTKMIELGGGDAYSYGLLGLAYASKQDYQAAEVAYRSALLLQPQNPQWRLGLTECTFRQEKYEDTVTLLNVLIERNPDNIKFWSLQAQAYLGMKQPLKAAENLEAIDRMGKSSADTLNLLGDIYVNEDLADLACSAYERAIDNAPNQPIAPALGKAEILSARGAAPQARQLSAHIEKAFDARLSDADRRKLLKLNARLSMAGGEASTDTVRILDEMVRLDPLDGDAWMLLGQCHSRRPMPPATSGPDSAAGATTRPEGPNMAIICYERAAAIKGFEANARIRHAQVLVGMRRYSEAVPLLVEAQATYEKPREDLARYLEQVQRFAKAETKAAGPAPALKERSAPTTAPASKAGAT